MLNGNVDCYVLAPERSARCAMAFLERFAPEREPSFVASDPGEVLCEPELLELDELLQYLEGYRWGEYSFYFRSLHPRRPPFGVILAFQAGGTLLFGASTRPTDADATELLDRMEEFAGTKGYWGHEEAPLETARQVRARVAKNSRPSYDDFA